MQMRSMFQKRFPNWPDYLIGLAIFILAMLVYNATLTPSLSYKSPDGNELASIPYVLGLAHATGYPLYTWLGKAFTYLPIDDVAHRMNLMSAIMGAGGVVFLYAIMRELTSSEKSNNSPISRVVSAFTALLFAFSLAFWSQTGIAEVYAPNVFMVTLTIWLLLRWARAREAQQRGAIWWLLAFSLSFGLSLGTHMSNLGFAPGFILFILLVDWRFITRIRELLGVAGAFFLSVLQFTWLPYKASTLNDAPMLRNAPSTLGGIYSYTLGAFPQFKFAFPLISIPERIVLYLYMLRQQYFIFGILLGLYGLAEMLVRKPKRFYLFVSMYLAQVLFFIQYRAFDLDVFFIPAHLLYAIFIGFGVFQLSTYLWGWIANMAQNWQKWARPIAGVFFSLVMIFPLFLELHVNWSANDYSEDVAINDFYENVWELLPQDSSILGRSGVFGYDMFYFRLVYDIRPDILIPHLDTPTPSPESLEGRDIFSTTPISPQQQQGFWGLPPGLVDGQSWNVPILFGQGSAGFAGRGRELILYHITDNPPELVVDDFQPQFLVGQRINGVELLGYDLVNDSVSAGGWLEVRFYWQIIDHTTIDNRLPLITTTLDEILLETHELGLGNLLRYAREFNPPANGIMVENYMIVIPSILEPGTYTLRIGIQDPFSPGGSAASQSSVLDLTKIKIE
ncbi:MAG: DUF2723 domain-containing protein [Chloroflexi bacterium]|nr:DUF2723 domain-containing protein [Chloroflexota bacterium]